MEAPRPRGRPRTFDREHALAVATELFWRYGYDGTSIADLTQQMGVTPPTLYAAFGSKEQLYREALLNYIRSNDLLVQQVVHNGVPIYSLIETYLYKSAEAYTDPAHPPGCMLQLAALTCALENVEAHKTGVELRQETFQFMVASLEWAKEREELPPDTNVLALARMFMALLQGMSIQAVDGASTHELKELVTVALAAWPGKRPHEAATG
jgi:AcrR family transcriptional regulator